MYICVKQKLLSSNNKLVYLHKTNSMKDYKALSKITFDEQADYYDADNTAPVSKYPKICYPFVLNELKQIKFSTLLDIGCGTGMLTSLISKEMPKSTLTGVDLSDKMIAQAMKKNLPNATFAVGDAENLDYADESFDAIICILSIHHHPNYHKTLAGMMRMLKPNGTVIICEMTPPYFMRFMYNKVFLKYLNTGDVHIFSKKELAQDLTNAGFKNVEVRSIHRYLCLAKAVKC